MKKLNKKVLTAVCFILTAFAFLGCDKKVKEITNDEAASAALTGSWKRTVKVESSVCSDPEDPDTEIGVVTAIQTTGFNFKSDLTFEAATSQEVESYTVVDENYPYTLEDMKGYLNSSSTIYGTYAADSTKLQLTNDSITLSDGTNMPAEEYAKYDSTLGNGIIQVDWEIDGDSLFVSTTEGKEVTTVEYIRIKNE